MSGPAPKPVRRRRNMPARGDWQPTVGTGWQFSPFPALPDDLMPHSVIAWETWLHAWYAAHWTLDELPLLRRLILLYDQLERGEFARSAEFRLLADGLGVTPKGQQDRRWAPPKAEAVGEPTAAPTARRTKVGAYAHLRVVHQ